MSSIKKAGMKGQGKVRMKGQGKVRRVEACLGMPGHVGTCPGRECCRHALETGRQPSRPIRSRHEALTDQSGADTKPSPSNQELTRSPWTPITAEPAFSSLYGRPSPGYKTLPRPHRLCRLPFPPQTPFTPADSLCFADPASLPCLPAPGSSARERPPNKRP